MASHRNQSAEWQKLYSTARWRRVRHSQLSEQPLCRWCLERDVVEPATEVHHEVPHKGDMELFWSGPFVSLCKPCHSSRGQRDDRSPDRGCDVDGIPFALKNL